MSPQTHHPILWQNQAAVAAATAATQGWTQFFPRQYVVPHGGVAQSVSPHGGARYQPQPQPYPAYTSHTPPSVVSQHFLENVKLSIMYEGKDQWMF